MLTQSILKLDCFEFNKRSIFQTAFSIYVRISIAFIRSDRSENTVVWKAIAVLSDKTSFHLVLLSSYVVFPTLHVVL